MKKYTNPIPRQPRIILPKINLEISGIGKPRKFIEDVGEFWQNIRLYIFPPNCHPQIEQIM